MKLIVDFLGVCAEVFMLYYLYDNILQRKPQADRYKTLTFYAAVGLILMLISTFVGQPRVRTLLYLFATFLPTIILYKDALAIKAIVTLFYMAIQPGVEMFTKAIFLNIFGSSQITAAQYYEISVLLSKALAFFAVYFVTSLFRVRAHTLPRHLFLPLMILPIATMIVIYQQIDASYLLNTRRSYLNLLISSSLLIAANIATFYLFSRMSEMEMIRRHNALMALQSEIKQKQYAQLANHQLDIRRMNHDLKRHLRLLGDYIRSGQADEALQYIAKQEAHLADQQLTITSYALIDGLLSSKKELAQQLDILLDAEAHWRPDQNIPEADLTLILDNGIDNALEAVEKLSDADSRWVKITLLQQKEQLYILIKNPVDRPLKIQQGRLLSTKADPAEHGFGLDNMRQLAKRHNGMVSFDCPDHIFTLRIMVNISNVTT